MKKQTFLSVLFFLFLFTFIFNKAKAGPGDSCHSAINLTSGGGGGFTDYAFHSPDTAVWFSFIADSANMLIALSKPVLAIDTPAEYIHTIKLYSGTCGSLTLLSSNTIAFFGSDTLPSICKTGLTPGTKYYVSVSKYNTIGCRICNKYPSYFSIQVIGLFGTVMSTATCISPPCGSNLVCNGDFNDPPSPYFIGGVHAYDMGSTAHSCSANSNMIYSPTFGPDGDYTIASIPASTYYVVTTGPTGQPYSFCGNSQDVGNNNNPCSVIVWQQGVTVVPNAQYQWTVYYKDYNKAGSNGGQDFPWATLAMDINGGQVWSGGINNTNFNSWTPVCENWTAASNQTSALLQIVDNCGPASPGYDFLINGISFAMIEPPPPAISGLQYACGTSPYTYSYSITNALAGASYTWSVSGTSNSISSPGTSVTATLTTIPATITCTCTVTGGSSCTATSTFTVGACCASATYTITNEDVSQVGSIPAGSTVVIDGTFTVDQNFTFTDCDIKFTPNASIVLSDVNSNNPTLTIISSGSGWSHLHSGCSGMWNGIFINPNCTLDIDGTADPILVEDAENAVVVTGASSPGTYTFYDVVFNKNYQDIVIDPTNANYNGFAQSCIFTCRNITSVVTNPFLWYSDWETGTSPQAISLLPYSGDYTYTGIYLNTVGAYSNFTGCYFDNLQYGIYAYRSSAGVYGNTFQNISAYKGSNTAILAQNCLTCSNSTKLTVGGPITWQQNSFTNCNYGIVESYVDYTTIDNNTFDNTGYAPFVYAVEETGGRLHSNGTLSIHENTIDNAVTGVKVSNNLAINGDISCNTITDPACTGYNYTGILVSEVKAPKSAIYYVGRNAVTVPNSGIVTSNTNGISFATNTIDLGYGGSCPPSSVFYGIQMTGCTSPGAVCSNLIESSPSLSSNKYTAIEESQSPSTWLNNNSTENTSIHIQLDGSNSANSTITQEDLTTGTTGIFTTGGALNGGAIGEQVRECKNSFSGFTGSGACEVKASGVTYYYYTQLPTSCLSAGQAKLGAYWISVGCSITYTDCTTPMPSTPSLIVPGDSLMSLFVDSVAINAFHLMPDSTAIAYMENVVALNHDTFPNYKDTDIALAKEGVVRVLWDNPSLLSSYTILHNFNDSMSMTPMGAILAIDSTIPHITALSGYTSLLSSLNSITPHNNVEVNLQTATWGYLTYLINDTLTPSQVSTIRVLADKCPDWDGDAVYQARALLSMYDSAGIEYNDTCYKPGGSHHAEKRENDVNSISGIQNVILNLYPNPNNGNFTLEYDLGNNVDGKVILYNMFGQMVGTYTLSNSQGKMSISNPKLSNGVYVWKLYTTSQSEEFGKVIIMK